MTENADLEPTETPSEPEDMTGTPPTDDEPIELPPTEEEVGLGSGEGEGDDEPESYAALRAKYPNLSDREFKEQVGDQYWEAKNYASRVARENVELREMLADQEEPEEPPSHPQIEQLDKRIQGLYDKDQATQKTQQEVLTKLADADKSIAKVEARLEDAADDDYAKGTLQARLEAAQAKRQSIIDRYGALNDKREGFAYEMERLLTDKDWLTKVAQQQVETQKSERVSDAKFDEQFPEYVDSLIDQTADGLEAPKDERTRQSLWTHVNRAMMVELSNMGEADLEEVDVPEMVEAYVQEYLTDRDLVSRTRFEASSEEKRRVTAPRRTEPVPAAKRPPVKPSLMSQGDTTPQMLRARKYLSSKGL